MLMTNQLARVLLEEIELDFYIEFYAKQTIRSSTKYFPSTLQFRLFYKIIRARSNLTS